MTAADDQSKSQLPTGIVTVLPVFKGNLPKASEEWVEANKDLGEERFKTRPGSDVKPMANVTETQSIANMGEKGAYSRTTNDDAPNTATRHREKVGIGSG